MSLRVCLIRVARTSPSVLSKRTIASATPISSRLGAISRKFKDSLRSRDVPELHRSYTALVKAIQSSGQTSAHTFIELNDLMKLVGVLGASGRSFDTVLIQKVLSDMAVLFGIDPCREIHTSIISSLLSHGHKEIARSWLLIMPKLPGHFSPNLEQWHMFIQSCYNQGDLQAIRGAIASMPRSGCKPTNATYKILIRALLEYSPRPRYFHTVIEKMHRLRLPYDRSVAALIHDDFPKSNVPKLHVKEIQDLYDIRFPPPLVGPSNDPDRDGILSREVDENGVEKAVILCRTWKVDGFIPSPHTLSILLRGSKEITVLHYLEKELDVQANVVHWSILVNNNVRSGRLTNALAIYAASKGSGTTPDSALVHPIINALCRTAFKPPTEACIDQALEIYQDLEHVDKSRGAGPDATIYDTLLRALASSKNVAKYFPVFVSLIEDMQSRKITLNNSMVTTSTIVLFMRSASSFQDAFDAYRRMLVHVKGKGIDAAGFAVILNVFTQLPFGIPPLQYYFDIVKDMRAAGHDMTVEVYHILLRCLKHLATRTYLDKSAPEETLAQLAAVIRRTHHQLTLDASISPDVAIWNQLLDSYQRAGCFTEACKVWDSLYISGKFDHFSVTIIFDACGFAGDWDTASTIYRKLQRLDFLLNQHNWNTWLECLCRLGKLDEAVRVACLEMGRQQDDVAPDIDTARILLKFSLRTNQQNAVRSRIKRYLPELWAKLPRDLQGYV